MSRVGKNIVLFVICCVFMPVITMAESTYDEHGDLIRPNAERFSGTFEDFGPEVDGVVSLIIMNDTNYKIDRETVYRDKDGGKSSLSRFKVGMLVDFYAIENLVTNLSVSGEFDENSTARNNDQSTSVPIQGKMRQEGGVWKN